MIPSILVGLKQQLLDMKGHESEGFATLLVGC
jgi:hypothetical protein